MKSNRQAKLLALIKEQAVETQEELTELLRVGGFETTQATISRDIKELRLTKIPTENGRYRYALPPETLDENHINRLRGIFKESVVNVTAAQNIVVLKTLPALASAACSALDAMNSLDIVGTLAGDDTAFIVTSDQQSAQHLRDLVLEMLS